MPKYIPIIGMECHVELKTKSKMFCGCPAHHFGKEPNTQTCPVCLGLPGALPVPNQTAIEWTVMIGMALNCQINATSKFDRKHYFYPDLPKGYQISQYDFPFAYEGKITVNGHQIRITRAHLEEDTGKLQHTTLDGKKVSLVDFNRSSVPLVEIVTEPDVPDADTALEYGKAIQRIMRFLGVSDADMEKGSMRLEANISLKRPADKGYPDYKVEVKNLNSFKFLKKAIEYEIKRQSDLLDQGITPVQETRGWHESKSITISQRTKEAAADYRYFPDPDLPPIHLSDKTIQSIKQGMPLLPNDYLQKFQSHTLRPDYASTLLTDHHKSRAALALLEQAVSKPYTADQLIGALLNDKISASNVISHLQAKSNAPSIDVSVLENLIEQVINEHPDLVEKYKSGKTSVLGAFIGPILKLSKGQADPKKVQELLRSKLDTQ